jgi:hypothetical protein
MSHRAPIAFLVTTALAVFGAAAPAAAQHGQLAAAPPDGAQVHRFTLADWQDALCAGANEWTFAVPGDHWIAFPIGWYAVDEATARDNWQHMRYEIMVGDQALEAPADPAWEVEALNIACPDRTVTGVAVSPVVYVPPLTGETTYSVSYLFDETVNDGWYDFEKGSRITMVARLQPEG